MHYIEAVKLGVMVLTLLIELVRSLKENNGDVDGALDKSITFLAKIGEVAKIKELNTDNLTVFVPLIRDLVKQLSELKKLSDQ